MKPKYKIILKKFSDQLKRIQVTLKRQDSQQCITQTADQLSRDKTLINALSQEDAHCIGFIAGYEHAQCSEKAS